MEYTLTDIGIETIAEHAKRIILVEKYVAVDEVAEHAPSAFQDEYKEFNLLKYFVDADGKSKTVTSKEISENNLFMFNDDEEILKELLDDLVLTGCLIEDESTDVTPSALD